MFGCRPTAIRTWSVSRFSWPSGVATVARRVVYTSSGCSKCAILKKWFKNINTDFEEKNLEDVDVMADLVMRNVVVLSAPALEVEGTVYTEDQIFDGGRDINTSLSDIFQGM